MRLAKPIFPRLNSPVLPPRTSGDRNRVGAATPIRFGVDPSIQEALGQELLQAIRAGQYHQVAELLTQRGAPANFETYQASPLNIAVSQGNLEMTLLLVQAGAEVNREGTKCHTTPLMAAVQANKRDMVTVLLALGADPNQGNIRQETPLKHAIKQNNLDIATLLLQSGANPNAGHLKDAITPLALAALESRYAMVTLLLDHQANIEVKNNIGMTALHKAAASGDNAMVRLLLARGASVLAQSNTQLTPLMAAIQSNHPSTARILTNAGANLNARDTEQQTPLSLAARTGNLELVEMVLEHPDFDPTVQKTINEAFIRAVSVNNLSIVKRLLPLHPDVNASAFYEKVTPLMSSLSQPNSGTMVEVLLALGANPNLRDRSGKSALEYALNRADRETADIAQLLLTHGADPNAPFSNGNLPLAESVSLMAPWLLSEMIRHGADVNGKNKKGETALMEAAGMGNYRATQTLLAQGADPTLVNKHAETALDYAYAGLTLASLLPEETMPTLFGNWVNWNDTIGLLKQAGAEFDLARVARRVRKTIRILEEGLDWDLP